MFGFCVFIFQKKIPDVWHIVIFVEVLFSFLINTSSESVGPKELETQAEEERRLARVMSRAFLNAERHLRREDSGRPADPPPTVLVSSAGSFIPSIFMISCITRGVHGSRFPSAHLHSGRDPRGSLRQAPASSQQKAQQDFVARFEQVNTHIAIPIMGTRAKEHKGEGGAPNFLTGQLKFSESAIRGQLAIGCPISGHGFDFENCHPMIVFYTFA